MAYGSELGLCMWAKEGHMDLGQCWLEVSWELEACS